MSNDKPWRDEATLHKFFVEKAWNRDRIAERLGCSPSTISNWVDRHGLKRPWKDPERLERLYWEEEKSLKEVGREMNCHWTTVREWMEKHDIDRRNDNIDPNNDAAWKNTAFIEELYVNRGMTREEICAKVGMSKSALRSYMAKEQIAETQAEIDMRSDKRSMGVEG